MSKTKALRPMPTLLPALTAGSEAQYIQSVNQVPILTAAEEQDLANRLYYQNDLEAAKRLVLSHLRFVVKIARGYLGYGLALSDLIQEGNIGLMKAVRRFNPKLGVRLVSFAVHWVKSEIHEFIIRNWRIVKVATTKAQRKLFFNLRKASKRLGWFNQAERQAVADELNVNVKEVERMEARLSAYDEGYDAPYADDGSDTFMAPENFLEDKRYNPEQLLEKSDWSQSRETRLHEVLATLDQRSREILESRWLAENKATLHDLAAKYDISAERVRQIEKMAMQRMREVLS